MRVLLTLALMAFGAAAQTQPATLSGSVTHVRDVDTIEVRGQAIRLQGLDGPELGTRAGQDGLRFVERLLRGRQVACSLTGERSYDRWIGTCSVDGTDLGAIIVGEGYALDCARYSGGRYAHLETPAARSRLPRSGYCR